MRTRSAAGRAVQWGAVAAALTLACNLLSPALLRPSIANETRLPLQPDGPLRGMGFFARADGSGLSGEPRLLFSTDDKEILAVVGLGKDVPDGAVLKVAWYRVTGVNQREPLFTHEIRVGPGGAAFSRGIAPGGLAPGHYETVATLADWQVRSPWISQASGPAPVNPSSRARFGHFAQARQVGEPTAPDPGDAWWSEDAPAPPAPPPGPCTVAVVAGNLVSSVWFIASATVTGTCSALSVAASAGGGPVTLASKQVNSSDSIINSVFGGAEFCDLPGGSDFPGTVVHLLGTGSEGAILAQDWVLPDNGSAFIAAIDSTPASGSRIDPASTIELHIVAAQAATAFGIERLRLFANGELLEEGKNLAGSDEPVPCEPLRYAAEIKTSYRVPDDPPPVIEICAQAAGFGGEEARECADFYTDEVWSGTMTSDIIVASPPSPDGSVNECTARYQTVLRFGVGEDGVIAGSAMSTPLTAFECTQAGPDPTVSIPWILEGARSASGFTIRLLLSPDWAFGQEAGMSTLSESPISVPLLSASSASTAIRYYKETEGVYGTGFIQLNHELEIYCVSCSP